MYNCPVNHGDMWTHSGGGCECLSSDRTGAYVHGLSLMPKECLPVSDLPGEEVRGGAMYLV